MYTHTVDHHSATEQNEILPFATGMDCEGIIPSEVSQRKTNPSDLTYMWNRKQTNKQKQGPKNRLVVARAGVEMGEGKGSKGKKKKTPEPNCQLIKKKGLAFRKSVYILVGYHGQDSK